MLLGHHEIEVGKHKSYPVYSYNQYLEEASGSQGLSRLQWYSIFLVFVIKLSAYLITMNIGFIKMFPDFECQFPQSSQANTFSQWESCEPITFCDH